MKGSEGEGAALALAPWTASHSSGVRSSSFIGARLRAASRTVPRSPAAGITAIACFFGYLKSAILSAARILVDKRSELRTKGLKSRGVSLLAEFSISKICVRNSAETGSNPRRSRPQIGCAGRQLRKSSWAERRGATSSARMRHEPGDRSVHDYCRTTLSPRGVARFRHTRRSAMTFMVAARTSAQRAAFDAASIAPSIRRPCLEIKAHPRTLRCPLQVGGAPGSHRKWQMVNGGCYTPG
jgi:hypothetical protein